MKNSSLKAFSFLSLLIFCIYTLRKVDLSFSSPLSLISSRYLEVQANDEASMQTMCTGFAPNQAFNDTQLYTAGNFSFTLDKIRGGNQMINVINNISSLGSDNTSSSSSDSSITNQTDAAIAYGKTFAPIIVFMGVFFLITLFFYMSFMCTCCSNGKKVCCCCEMGDLKTGKCFYGVLSILLLASVIGVSIAGLNISSHFEEDTTGAICTMNLFLEDLENGSLEDDWIGLYPASNSLNSILTHIDDLAFQGGNFDEIHDSFNDQYNAITDSLADSYSNFNGKTLPRVDQTAGTTYIPVFISVSPFFPMV